MAQVKQLGGGTGTSLPTDVAGSILGLDQVRELFAVRGPAARDILAYWLALLLAVGTFILVYRLLRSRYGLALSAIGDAEAAAESAGVDVFRTKLLIYVLTAIATGMSPEHSSSPEPPVAGCSPATASARPVSTLHAMLVSSSEPLAFSVISAAPGSAL